MTKDKRLYARFDIGMDEHPKIMLLSDAAFRALVESTLYARRQLTDGFLNERVALRKWGAEVAAELAANDAERPSWVRVDGGWQIHDFAEHQTTRADIEAKREAGSKGGRAKAQNAVARASDSLEHSASTSDGTSVAKTETETETPSSTKKARERRKPETPLPDSWSPNETHVRIARERGVDGRREELQFRDHAAANDRRQRDWDAAFRTWLRNAKPQRVTPGERAQRTVMLATDLVREIEQ